MACAGWHFLWSMVVDADQSVMSRLPIIPDRSLLFEQPKSVAFEHAHQLTEPQNTLDLSPVYRQTASTPPTPSTTIPRPTRPAPHPTRPPAAPSHPPRPRTASPPALRGRARNRSRRTPARPRAAARSTPRVS